MLNKNNIKDLEKMKNYYRTSDMLNLLEYFPDVSPVKDIVIVEDEQDYLNNVDFLKAFPQNRVDSLKGRKVILGIENRGLNEKDDFIETLRKVKEKDPLGVIVLFSVDVTPSERYTRYAGISVGVDLGRQVYIDAVSKGFDGREVSKSICTHERYCIPWNDLRSLGVANFKKYQTYQINDKDYQKTRDERLDFLISIGVDYDTASKAIPEKYTPIPDFIWASVIKGVLKKLEKEEDILLAAGFNSFAISGHTEGKRFAPWQMFDKSRYTLYKKE